MQPADLTIPVLLQQQADRFGDKPLVRSGEAVWSYRHVVHRASYFAHALQAAGLEPGDRIAVFCDNRLQFLKVWLGAAWAGAITVPINTALRGPQLGHVLSHSGTRFLVAGAELLERFELVAPEGLSLERIWCTEDSHQFTDRLLWNRLAVEPLPDGSEAGTLHRASPGDTAMILYTGGTTGPSKGVACPHAQPYWWGRIVAGELGLGEDDILHTTLPLFHTNALHTVWQALLTGATVSLGQRFSASRFWTELADANATVTYLLGPMVKILLLGPSGDHEREHHVRIALAPGTAEEDVDEFERRSGITLVNSYGSTETNMITSTQIEGARRGTMGPVIDLFEAAVVNEHDFPVPVGEPGELLVRPKQPFSFFTGYWHEPEQTVRAWRNLWFHTGDRVVADGDGCLRFVDRMTDSIRRRGENISSWEVERVLLQHPEVSEAAVVGVDAQLGESEVLAFLVPADGRRLDPQDIVSFCEPLLAAFAIPRYVEVVAELPRTQVGRVQKFLLRQRGLGAQTWDRERSRDAS